MRVFVCVRFVAVVALVCFLAAIPVWGQMFPSPVLINPGTAPATVIASGDFNRDGHADIVLANANQVNVYFGNADGTFEQPVPYAINGTPRAMLAQDLNHDSIPDLVAYNDNGTISVLLGNSDGTFQAAVSYSAGGTNAFAMITADFNGDGNPDLAVVNDSTVNVITGNGDGTFALPVTVLEQDVVSSIAAGDFNSDGKMDLVVGSSAGQSTGFVTLMLGNGDGTFLTPVAVNVAPDTLTTYFIDTITASDFNGDHNFDLAVGLTALPGNGRCATLPSDVVILISNGDGTFQAPVPYPVGLNPKAILSGDLDLDGAQDLAVTDLSNNAVSILRGNGDGTFQPSVSYFTNDGAPLGITLGDFNGDGIPDLAIPSTTDSVVLFGSGGARFKAPVATAVPVTPPACNAENAGGVVAGDFDGDGKLDVAVGNQPGFFLGNADGTFQQSNTVATGSGSALPASFPSSATDLAVGDFNGDGRPDVVTLNPIEDGVISISNIGVVYAPSSKPRFTSLAVGDFNNDGLPDIAAVGADDSSGLVALLNNGDGTFTPVISSQISVSDSLKAGDFNLDGKLDLALINRSGANQVVGIALGNGDGTFGPFLALPTAASSNSVAVADVNKDGKPDLVVAHGSVGILLGEGTGEFLPEIIVNTGDYVASAAVVADLDGDGNPDVAVTTSQDTVGILLGNGDGTFQAIKNYPVGPWPLSVAVADIDQDGLPDLIVTDRDSNLFSVLLNQGSGTPSLTTTAATVSPSANQLAPGATLTLTAKVTSSSGTPAGMISFQDGATTLGSALLDGSAQATLDTNFIDPGTHTITAVYSGASTFRGSTTAPSSVIVTGVAVSDFSFAVADGSSTSATVNAGQTATYNFNVSGSTTFNGTVAATCSGAPATTVCTIAPSSIVLSGTTPVAVTVTITTTAPSTAANLGGPGGSSLSVPSSGVRSSRVPSPVGPSSRAAFALGVFILMMVVAAGIGKRRFPRLLGTAAALLLMGFLLACSGGGNTPTPPQMIPGTPTGNYAITITGTDGSLSHTVTLMLNVN